MCSSHIINKFAVQKNIGLWVMVHHVSVMKHTLWDACQMIQNVLKSGI